MPQYSTNSAEEFLRPVAYQHQAEIVSHIREQSAAISTQISSNPELCRLYNLRRDMPLEIKVGSEFEITFFDKDYDHILNNRDVNYNPLHEAKVTRLKQQIERELGDILQDSNPVSKEGRLTLEIRLKPLDPEQALEAYGKMREWFSVKSQEMGIIPSIHSHHNHFSLWQGATNCVENNAAFGLAVGNGVLDMSRRALPTLHLPHEIDPKIVDPDAYSYDKTLNLSNF